MAFTTYVTTEAVVCGVVATVQNFQHERQIMFSCFGETFCACPLSHAAAAAAAAADAADAVAWQLSTKKCLDIMVVVLFLFVGVNAMSLCSRIAFWVCCVLSEEMTCDMRC
jgi:membrane-associated phospholipid phosphatase